MISIQHENAFFLVMHKPHNVSVHNEHPSLLEWLNLHNCPTNFVNRLDLQTSGLVIVAKKPELQEPLQQALHLGEKKYKALLRGNIIKQKKLNPDDVKSFHLTWNQPLSDKAEGRRNPQGQKADQKPCLTLVEIKRSNQYFTEVECILKTGRQHQIRKHACLYEHPIVGDPRYNEEKYNKQIAKFYQDDRLLLHAAEITFEFNNQKYLFKDESFSLDKYFV